MLHRNVRNKKAYLLCGFAHAVVGCWPKKTLLHNVHNKKAYPLCGFAHAGVGYWPKKTLLHNTHKKKGFPLCGFAHVSLDWKGWKVQPDNECTAAVFLASTTFWIWNQLLKIWFCQLSYMLKLFALL